MEDLEIIALYFERDEKALSETMDKYGKYCHTIAKNITGNREDASEILNETMLKMWNSIPPESPSCFMAYIGKITRSLSLNRHAEKHAQKRGGGVTDAVLEELKDIVSDSISPEEELDHTLLLEAVNAFLGRLSAKKRKLFVLRYWYGLEIFEIAKRSGMSENAVSVALNRIRKQLKQDLIKGGFTL